MTTKQECLDWLDRALRNGWADSEVDAERKSGKTLGRSIIGLVHEGDDAEALRCAYRMGYDCQRENRQKRDAELSE